MLSTGKLNIIHETKFNSIYAEITNPDFVKLGFALGDSLDVYFSNGFKMLDVPYFDGFYVKTGEYIVSGYPSYPYVSVGINNQPIWPVSGCKENNGETLEIVLHEKGKYLKIQEAFSQKHPPRRDYYVSDEAFANFRPLKAKNMKENFLIRGGSPVNDDFGFMTTADRLIKEHHVQYVLNLSETRAELDEVIKPCKGFYIEELYRKNAISCLDLSANPRELPYAQKLCQGLKDASDYGKGPVYYHCMEGKDRTGFCSVLLLALCGGTMEDFEQDYMMTYRNFYYVDKEKTPEKYNLIRDFYFIDNIMNFLCNTTDVKDFSGYNYYDEAVKYLKYGGLNEQEIKKLIAFISKN